MVVMVSLYIYVMWIYFMIIVFLMLWGISVFLYMMKIDLMVEWVVFSINSIMIEVFILVDWVSCLFISLVLMISSMVIMYSVSYMSMDKFKVRFLYLVISFVVSMILMILSPSLVSVLLGWDMLGLVSYCLVIYYQNLNSFNSGMVTVLFNRIGDVGLLISIGIMLIYGSWNIYLMDSMSFLVIWMILLASVTKSAQMPFSSWLPMAMAAPTPVSSLVHSSTLVTAGVYLIIRFNSLVMEMGVNYVLLFLSVLTMFMSGFMANYEYDLKKIIALSTLSQLGLMMMTLSLGLKMLSFYHLLTHAVFKSLLFLCAGAIIHVMSNSQDIRYYGNLNCILPFVMMSFYISVFSLMGFPFMAGFYSKDLIIEVLYIFELNFIYLVLIYLSLMLTVMYSLRLCYYLYFGSMKFKTLFLVEESFFMNISMLLLLFFSVIMGSFLNWLFFVFEFVVYLMMNVKFLILLSLIFSWVVGLFLNKFVDLFYGVKNYLVFSVSMWMLNYLHVWGGKNLVFLGENTYMADLSWVEILEVQSWVKAKMVMMDLYYYGFKFYYIIFLQVFFLLVLSWNLLV